MPAPVRGNPWPRAQAAEYKLVAHEGVGRFVPVSTPPFEPDMAEPAALAGASESGRRGVRLSPTASLADEIGRQTEHFVHGFRYYGDHDRMETDGTRDGGPALCPGRIRNPHPSKLTGAAEDGRCGVLRGAGEAPGGHRPRDRRIRSPEENRAEFHGFVPVPPGKVAVVCRSPWAADLPLLRLRRRRRRFPVCDGNGKKHV